MRSASCQIDSGKSKIISWKFDSRSTSSSKIKNQLEFVRWERKFCSMLRHKRKWLAQQANSVRLKNHRSWKSISSESAESAGTKNAENFNRRKIPIISVRRSTRFGKFRTKIDEIDEKFFTGPSRKRISLRFKLRNQRKSSRFSFERRKTKKIGTTKTKRIFRKNRRVRIIATLFSSSLVAEKSQVFIEKERTTKRKTSSTRVTLFFFLYYSNNVRKRKLLVRLSFPSKNSESVDGWTLSRLVLNRREGRRTVLSSCKRELVEEPPV